MARALSLLLALVGMLVALPTSAQGSDPAAAEVLFREGRAAMEADRLDVACPKFAESQRLEPALGTLLNLAVCHQRQGKTATAWGEFLKAAAMAHRSGQEQRRRMAERRANALEPGLRYVRFHVAPETAQLPGVVLRVDGKELGKAAWDSKVPVDPGPHELDVEAEGHRPYRGRFEAPPDRVLAIEVPALKPAPKQGKGAAVKRVLVVERVTETSGLRQRTVGYWVGGAGIVAAGVGTFFGVQALGLDSSARELCPNSPCDNADGVDKSNQAVTSALLADVFVGVGIVGIGVGLYLVLTDDGGAAPSSREERTAMLPFDLRWTPTVGPDFGGLTLRGRW